MRRNDLVANTVAGMVQQGLSVPPPLRRGGGQKISTGPSIPPSGRAANNSTSARKGVPKPRRARTKKIPSEEIDSEDYESNSDAEYGKPRAKRVKIRSKNKQHTPTPGTSDTEEEIVSPIKHDIKREASSSSNDESSVENHSQKGDGDEVVAAGAGFLDLVDDDPTMDQLAPDPIKSLIVKLPMKDSIRPESPDLRRSNLDHLATVASGLPTYTTTSSLGTYPGFDLSVHHRHYSQADHAHSTSEFLSSGIGATDRLPESSLYGSMTSQPDISYSNGFEHFGDTNLGVQGMAEDGWNPTNSDYQFGGYDGSSAFTTPPYLNAHGTSTITGQPPSLPQLSTSFMLRPAVQEDTVGGEYFSSRPSTINHTPSSNLTEESVNIPWLTRDDSSTRQATGIDLNNVDDAQSSDITTLHQQYDGYGDGNACF